MDAPETPNDDEKRKSPVKVKLEPKDDIKDFAENTMNELLGWYGYDKVDSEDTQNLNLQRFASSGGKHRIRLRSESESTSCSEEEHVRKTDLTSPANSLTSENSLLAAQHQNLVSALNKAAASKAKAEGLKDLSSSGLPKGYIVCAWCQKTGLKLFTLKTPAGLKTFCSELCFTQCRRASFKKNKVCDWCKHVRHTVNYVDFQDGEQQLQFCSAKCLNQYKMNIFCKETQEHLQKIHSPVEAVPSTSSAGSADDERILITPDLWMQEKGYQMRKIEQDTPLNLKSAQKSDHAKDTPKHLKDEKKDCGKDIHAVAARLTQGNEHKRNDYDMRSKESPISVGTSPDSFRMSANQSPSESPHSNEGFSHQIGKMRTPILYHNFLGGTPYLSSREPPLANLQSMVRMNQLASMNPGFPRRMSAPVPPQLSPQISPKSRNESRRTPVSSDSRPTSHPSEYVQQMHPPPMYPGPPWIPPAMMNPLASLLPPPTVMMPHPIFIPVPLPIPVPVPIPVKPGQTASEVLIENMSHQKAAVKTEDNEGDSGQKDRDKDNESESGSEAKHYDENFDNASEERNEITDKDHITCASCQSSGHCHKRVILHTPQLDITAEQSQHHSADLKPPLKKLRYDQETKMNGLSLEEPEALNLSKDKQTESDVSSQSSEPHICIVPSENNGLTSPENSNGSHVATTIHSTKDHPYSMRRSLILDAPSVPNRNPDEKCYTVRDLFDTKRRNMRRIRTK